MEDLINEGKEKLIEWFRLCLEAKKAGTINNQPLTILYERGSGVTTFIKQLSKNFDVELNENEEEHIKAPYNNTIITRPFHPGYRTTLFFKGEWTIVIRDFDKSTTMLVATFSQDYIDNLNINSRNNHETTFEEKTNRIKEAANRWMEPRGLSSEDEKREFRNGFAAGYTQGSLDVIEIALERFCEIRKTEECKNNCNYPLCDTRMNFRRDLKQHLL